MLFVIACMTAGCAPAAGTQPPLLPAPTTVEAAAVTKIPIPSPTGKIILTPTYQPTLTATPEQKCLTIEDQLPADLDLEGVWVHGGPRPYLEDVKTGERKAVPLGGGTFLDSWASEFAVSPDGKWLAYIDRYLKEGRTSKLILRIIGSTGYSLDMSYWPGDFQEIAGWAPSGEILLEENFFSSETNRYVLLNPFTGVSQEFRSGWLDSIDPFRQKVFFNSKHDYGAVRTDGFSGTTLEIRDVNSGNILWDSGISYSSEIAWSPDGRTLAVFEDDSRLRLVGNGAETNEFVQTTGYFSKLTWAPSNQELLVLDDQLPKIVDVRTGEKTVLCVADDQFEYAWDGAIWSPDNRFILANMYRRTAGPANPFRSESFDLVVDLQQMRAYKLDSNGSDARIAWLARP